MVGALILSFVIVLDEVVWEVLSGCHIGDSEDFRSGNSRVVVFRSSRKFGTSLDLIIATCQVFRHLRTLEKTDDPRIQLSLADLIYAIGELTRCVMAQGSMD